MIHLITYDLHKPDRDYEDEIAMIRSFGSCVHLEESVWLVDTSRTASDCRDALKGVSEDQTVFVVRVTGSWSSYKLSQDAVSWLKSPERSW